MRGGDRSQPKHHPQLWEHVAVPPNRDAYALRDEHTELLLTDGGPGASEEERRAFHASPKITLDTYGQLFNRVEHVQRAPDATGAGFGAILPR